MSLLKWKELAKSKSELGNKINYVHDTITKRRISQKTNQESLVKAFEPVTSRLDDIVVSNLRSISTPKRKQRVKKGEVPDYGIDIDDEVEEMGLDSLFDQAISPQQEKQLVPKPPTYEESLKDLMEGKKEIYVDPQYLPEEPMDLPPEYDDEDEVDYRIDDEDLTKEILEDLGLTNYESIDKIINQPEMTSKKTTAYLNKILNEAKHKENQMKGYRTAITKQYNKGIITEAEKQIRNKQIDNTKGALKEYINHIKNKKLKAQKGSGGQKGLGNVMFFNNVKQLLKKLELIIGERLAGNTSIEMRNTGVAILDILLKMSTINKPQYKKLYNQYFHVENTKI